MTSSGVIPRRKDRPCDWCGDTGWKLDASGYAWDIPCPQGCPDATYGLDDDADADVPP